MSTKLDILYSRNLHQLAIQFAESANLPNDQVNTIVAQYADYLFSRAEYDSAIQQYLRAIDTINSSEVIRKFLDVQRIANLVQILEELHAQKLANADHTTLLLNCYARLKNVDQLEKFIRDEGGEFDVDTAIQVCRQGRYYEQAAFLAQKYGEHDTFISILVENLKQYSRALKYIKQLPPSEVLLFLMKLIVGGDELARLRKDVPWRMARRNYRFIYHVLQWTLRACERTGTFESNEPTTIDIRRTFIFQRCRRYYKIRPISPLHDRQTKVSSNLPTILRKKHLNSNNTTSPHDFRNRNICPSPPIPTPPSARRILYLRRLPRMFYSFPRSDDGRRRLLLPR